MRARPVRRGPAQSRVRPSAEEALNELLAISDLSIRVQRVAEDVRSSRDYFSAISSFDLAEALGVPPPGEGWRGWECSTAEKIISVEDRAKIVDPPSSHVEELEALVSAQRFSELLFRAEELDEADSPDFSFLTAEERAQLELLLAKKALENLLSCGIGGKGRFTIPCEIYTMIFEADIEDDGTCCHLLSPYDYREGRFQDLSNCVIETYG